MTSDDTTHVMSVTVRVAGKAYTEVSQRRVGKKLTVTMTTGPIVCTVWDPYLTIGHVRDHWLETAMLLAMRLPERVDPRLAQAGTDTPVGIVVRLDGFPACGSAWVTARRETRTPAHLLVRVGPLVFQILDKSAYTAMTAAWTKAWKLIHD